jgi:hypothetical protein
MSLHVAGWSQDSYILTLAKSTNQCAGGTVCTSEMYVERQGILGPRHFQYETILGDFINRRTNYSTVLFFGGHKKNEFNGHQEYLGVSVGTVDGLQLKYLHLARPPFRDGSTVPPPGI